QEIANEIAQTIDFLSSNRRDVPLRHRSIRAAIDHSWALLTTTEQRVLQHLAIFRGGFTRDAAQAVAQATLPRLTALLDKSLVQRVGDNRYDLHELVRQYAAAQLATMEQRAEATPATAQPTAAQSHARYYVELAEAARRHWHGPEQTIWAEQLQQELDNLRAAQAWMVAGGDLALAPRLANALWRFWEMRGYVTEGRRWIGAVLTVCEVHSQAPEVQPVRTQLLHVAGLLARIQGDFVQAQHYHLQSLALRRQQGDQAGVAAALIGLGNVAMFMGDYAAAEAYFQENLEIHRQQNDTRHIYITYNNLAIVAMYQGNYTRAQELHETVLAYHRQQGALDGIASALGNLGDVFRCQGKYLEAERALQESLTLFDQLQNVQGKVVTLNSLGRVALAVGQIAEAINHFAASLRLYAVASDKIALLDNLEGMAQVATRNQHDARAITLYGAATTLRHTLHIPLPAIDQRAQEESLTQLRTNVALDTFATAWSQGQSLTLEQAIAYALTGA
ncbi:MAG: tetratricopeptide repeat protein, partial [Caldilineaceae bacterium]|nr:tetratricopeptide repeat protein [Caldilineaceae bacterium]